MNKKGDERVTFIFMILVWVAIAFTIFAGVYFFYGADVDVRTSQAERLLNRALFCISDNGFINENFLKDDFYFFSECNVHPYYFKQEPLFFVSISIFEKESNEEIKSIYLGASRLIEECDLPDRKGQFVSCTSKEEFNLKGSEKEFIVFIRAGSNNFRRIK